MMNEARSGSPDPEGAGDGRAASRGRFSMRPRWKIALTLAILGLLLSQIDVAQATRLLRDISAWWLIPVALVQLLDRWLMAWKWRMLLNTEEQYIGTAEAFKVYYVAGFQGFIIPFGIGPDLVRYARLQGSGIPRERIGASLILERGVGIIATGLTAALSLLLFLYLLRDDPPGWVVPGGLVTTAVVILSMVFMRSDEFRSWIRRLPGVRRLERFSGSPWWRAIAEYRNRDGTLLRFFGWSVVEQYTTVLAVWFTALALGVPLSLLGCVAAVPVIQLLERLPLTVMGLGIREGSFAFLLGLLGVGYSEAILMALLEFTVFVLTLLPAGVWDAFSRRPLVAGAWRGADGVDAEEVEGH